MEFTPSSYKVLEAHQWDDPDNVWRKIKKLIETHAAHEPVVICESFELRPDVVMPDETPKYIIKDINRFVDYPIRYQLASQAKVGCPPARSGKRDRLHAFGLYQTGKRHANDAIRHCVVYAIETLRNKPLIRAGWAKPGRK